MPMFSNPVSDQKPPNPTHMLGDFGGEAVEVSLPVGSGGIELEVEAGLGGGDEVVVSLLPLLGSLLELGHAVLERHCLLSLDGLGNGKNVFKYNRKNVEICKY